MAFRRMFSPGRREAAARQLYAIAVRQARCEAFYLHLGVPDSVDGRFDLLVLHVFLILRRLGKAGRPAKALSQQVFDLMFFDMDANLREMGVSDLAVGGRVKTMAQAFYGRVDAYEAALEKGGRDMAPLGEALARNLFRGAAVEPSVLSALARYIVREDQALAGLALEELSDGKLSFGGPLLPEKVTP